MSRTGVMFLFLAGAAAQSGRQDYTDELMKLTTLTDNKQYREAISGYRKLQAEVGTPEWLKAASEYEIAELYGALREPSKQSRMDSPIETRIVFRRRINPASPTTVASGRSMT